jgi:hypothetical protein
MGEGEDRMKRLALYTVLALLALVGTAHAQMAVCPGVTRPSTAYTHETLTITGASTPLSSGVYGAGGKSPTMAEISLETNPIRYLNDGSAPTAAVGMLVQIPTSGGITFSRIFICGTANIIAWRGIATGSNASITVQYYQ